MAGRGTGRVSAWATRAVGSLHPAADGFVSGATARRERLLELGKVHAVVAVGPAAHTEPATAGCCFVQRIGRGRGRGSKRRQVGGRAGLALCRRPGRGWRLVLRRARGRHVRGIGTGLLTRPAPRHPARSSSLRRPTGRPRSSPARIKRRTFENLIRGSRAGFLVRCHPNCRKSLCKKNWALIGRSKIKRKRSYRPSKDRGRVPSIRAPLERSTAPSSRV